jgi:hypothetical protein
MTDETALESRARRAAPSAPATSRASRAGGFGTIDNRGEFQIVDPARYWIVAGEHYDMSPADVIAWCEERERGHGGR